jgi:hypothetical protein
MIWKSMNALMICFVSILFFNFGCQKQNKKNGSAMRCIYDQTVFADPAFAAVADEEKFQSFKKDPFYSLLYQGHSYQEGLIFLNAIEKDYPFLIEKFDRFRTSDLIGSPRTYDYGKYGTFSPTTLHYVHIAGIIHTKIGNLASKRIIQIGAAYGGLCKIMHDLTKEAPDANPWKSYAIVDLPEHLALARKVLEREGIVNVQFFTPDEIPSRGEYDLVLSDFSFSEFSRSYQQVFAESILQRAQSGYLLGHIFPKYFGVDAMNPYEFGEYFNKAGHSVLFEISDGKTDRANYSFLWNKQTTKELLQKS